MSEESNRPQTVFGLSDPCEGGSLIFFPDFGGNILYARPLVSQLSDQVSCYGLRYSADMISSFDHLTIEDITRRFAEDISRINLSRPVHLLGYSFAAALAYETARTMQSLGASPENVWILDLPAPRPFGVLDTLRKLIFYLKAKLRQLRRDRRRFFLLQPDPMILQRYGVIGFDLSAFPESYRTIIRHLYAAYGRYKTLPSVVPLTVLRAEKSTFRLTQSDDLGWRGFSLGPVEARFVPGDHLSMLRDDINAGVIAYLISAKLLLPPQPSIIDRDRT